MPQPDPSSTLDPSEVDRFAAIADEWWDLNGKFKPLHQIGPARLSFIRAACLSHFASLSGDNPKPFAGLSMIDIGCGGGLIAEPLARLGATVTGIDPAREGIHAAKQHALEQKLDIDYRAQRIEDIVEAGETFDVVTCLEVIEHIPDVAGFLHTCQKAVKPGGLFIGSTINRTMKSFGLAIIAAEYILGWLPRGTHRWDRFVTPEEFSDALQAGGLHDVATEGLAYNPLNDRWSLNPDTDVNYMISAKKLSA